MHLLSLLTTTLIVTSSCIAGIVPRAINPQSPVARELVHLVEPTSWFKDVVSRRDGSLLVVRLDKPSVYLVNPDTGSYSVITTFKNVTGALGIVEYAPDVFAVSIGDFNIPTLSSTPGTYSVVTLDLSRGLNADGTITPTTLAAIPAAKNLNGLAFRAPKTLYAADSKGFQIFSIDIPTRAVAVAVPPSPLLSLGSVGFPLGVTALQWDTRSTQLYFVNLNKSLLGRIPSIPGSTGLGAPQQIASSFTTGGLEYDDFDLDPYEGNIYIVTGPSNTLNFVSRDGTRQFVITPRQPTNTTILGGTSTAWGRGPNNTNTLYITTNGDVLLGAQILAYKFSTT